MTKKILIATKNSDKFSTVKIIIKKLCSCSLEFYSLKDFNIPDDVEEIGSVQNRAKQKADFYTQLAKEKQIQVDFILGIDDGARLEGETEISPNTKEIADKILSGEALEIGEKIFMTRSYCFLNSKTGAKQEVTTEDPYNFIGNPKNLKREEGKYVLAHVLSSNNSNKSIANTLKEEKVEHFISNAKEIQEIDFS